MGWVDIKFDRTREYRPRELKPPKLSIYKDGMAKLNKAAMEILGNPEAICVLHNTDYPTLVAVSVLGEYPHKISTKGLTFSASGLWQHAGRPEGALHVDLSPDPGSDLLVGDLATGRLSAPRVRRNGATVEASEGAPTMDASATHGEVDPEAVHITSSTPEATAVPPQAAPPSPLGDPYAEYETEDSEDYQTEAAS